MGLPAWMQCASVAVFAAGVAAVVVGAAASGVHKLPAACVAV